MTRKRGRYRGFYRDALTAVCSAFSDRIINAWNASTPQERALALTTTGILSAEQAEAYSKRVWDRRLPIRVKNAFLEGFNTRVPSEEGTLVKRPKKKKQKEVDSRQLRFEF